MSVERLRVCVLLHGLPRGCLDAAKSFREVGFAGTSPDVFAHFWRLRGDQTLSSHAGATHDLAAPEPSDLIEAFGLRKLALEDLDESVVDREFPFETNVEMAKRTLYRYASLSRTFRLPDLDAYDVVVTTRPDVVYFGAVDLTPTFDGTVSVPHVANARSGKNVVRRMAERDPEAVHDFAHDFIAVANPRTIRAYADFGDAYLGVCERYPLPHEPYFPDRALAIYLKRERGLTLREFPLEHGLQRDGWVKMYR